MKVAPIAALLAIAGTAAVTAVPTAENAAMTDNIGIKPMDTGLDNFMDCVKGCLKDMLMMPFCVMGCIPKLIPPKN
ncbi:hypothetical protein GQ42DRAFT_162380 [Ramicandelaber brevisporus]|nr:hypothetical protein GQ42DRAFT_162380 [Ramicandelaber brevisporus]